MDFDRLAELLFPDIDISPEDYEARYPMRNLPEGALVTRIGPSPTGFIHLGNLYNAVIGERLAHQSDGVFFLRIEDTDSKREVSGAAELILSSMGYFGISFDEGAAEKDDNGDYGPYRQRLRRDIYRSFAKRLVQKGLAYPCFCAEESLNAMRGEQKARKENFGYYGKWALCRNKAMDETEAKLADGTPYALRFRAPCGGGMVKVADAIRGELVMPENDQDFILLKSDGIPTYHFAHVVDDHLMRTTHVVRGEEWLATLPMHAQLFDALGWERPVYCHTAQLMKLEDGSKRKLSKRKDPELGLSYYRAEGYPPESIWEYLLTVLNSNYEEWRLKNTGASYREFKFTLEKMSGSGALFDLMKLNDVSKDVVAGMSPEEIYARLLEWAREYDRDFCDIISRDSDFSKAAISVGRGGDRIRKDFASWKQARDFLSFYYDEIFETEDEFPENVDAKTRSEVLRMYLDTLDFSDDNAAWFDKVKAITGELGYAVQPKLYKKNPELYRGSVTDISNTIRVALTGRRNSPDIREISGVLGEETVRRRIGKYVI